MKEKVNKIGKGKLILVGIFLVIILIILFGGAVFYNKFFYKRSYTEIESIMVNATRKYMTKNESKLPQNINESVTISAKDLVREEEMKDISDYLKDDSISCTGNVNVTNVNNSYRYIPNLDCGNSYKTNKFIDYIKNTQPIVESGDGLYNLNEQLVFRGENVKNYLKLSGKMYRIVKFDQDEAVIILTEKLESRIWDDRYNKSKNSVVGINDYSVSKIKAYLDEMYNGNSLIGIDKTTGINNKNLVVAYTLNIGRRSSKDVNNTGELEKTAVMEKQFIGLLPLNDFLNASIDKDCLTSTNLSCQNYNYLAKFKYNWWTMTATSLNTFEVYKITKVAVLSSASSSAYLRPVLHLAKDAIYVSGNGTYNNPYVVK